MQGSTLRHYSLTGQVLQTRPFGSARLRAVVLYTNLLPPTLAFTTPPANALLNTDQPVLTLSVSDTGQGVDPSTVQLQVNGTTRPVTYTATATEVTCTPSTALPEGQVALTATIEDFAGNVSTPATLALTIDTTPPAAPTVGHITIGPVTDGHVTITGAAGSVKAGEHVRVTNSRTGETVTVIANPDGSFTIQLGAQAGDSLTVVVRDSAGNSSTPLPLPVATNEPLPPDPSTVAPPLDLTVATDIFTATQFLYTGVHPIQTGVVTGIIDPKRVAVIRGKVLRGNGQPFPGVTVTVLNHPEFGQTLSRGDGMFDLVVNGGGILTVTYTKPNYLPAQRQVDAPWRDYVFAAEVALIPRDSAVTAVTFGDTAVAQVARGNPVTDSDGARRATILFPEGTQAELECPDGTREPRTTLHIRATEYTVGENGPTAMPAALPPSSAYTYAVELDADEAVATGATTVQFDRPVSLYVENFLGFPVGADVPLGFYDRGQGLWLGAENGRVIKFVGITGGMAEVDTDGDGTAEEALTLESVGITAPERLQLAATYAVGQELWRATMSHFSSPDLNWGGGGDGGGGPDDENDEPDDECLIGGSIIGCESQSLGERTISTWRTCLMSESGEFGKMG